MKFFLDTANLDEIRKIAGWGIIDGVTTNPSLIAKEGVPLEEQIRRICGIVQGDVSAEVISTTAKEMVAEGRVLARIHENVVIKVPLTKEGIIACSLLSKEGVRVNVTLCFSAAQALLAAKAGAYIVSPFVGRVEDIGWPGIKLIEDAVSIFKNYGLPTQVLATSIRGPLQVIESAKAGAHIATLPPKVLDQLFYHPLTEKGLEQFLGDYNKAFEFTKV
ncbi:MAG TPA: fructose-6-phosphate aldolase [Bryobacteraceae bacterium]|nr:fructose-6-phosphate aldolase [Bryobacteraceae bacterium]